MSSAFNQEQFDGNAAPAISVSSSGSRSSLIGEHENSEIPLVGTSESVFKSLYTYFISLINILVFAVFGIFVWTYPGWPQPTEWSDQEHPIFIYICMNGWVWLIVAISDRLFSHYHHVVRRHGYLEFYGRTECLRRLPFYTFSATSVSLSIVLASCMRWIPELVEAQPSRLVAIQLFLTIQILIILPIYVAYTIIVVQFNWTQPVPDVDGAPFGGAAMTASTASLSIQQRADVHLGVGSSPDEVGIRDEPRLEQLLDRQADLITYYRQRNHHLMRKIARLSALVDQHQDSALRLASNAVNT